MFSAVEARLAGQSCELPYLIIAQFKFALHFGMVEQVYKNTNRAVAMIEWPSGSTSPGELAKEIKIHLGQKIGYFPFLYPLGLQVIVCGNSVSDHTEGLDRYLDNLDNQRVILQSLHVVDIRGLQSSSVRTWWQFVSGHFQDAIEKGIREFISVSKHP